jgi:hypothetical protein
MRAPMKLSSLLAPLLLLCASFGFGCGKEIGDACIISSDCSPNGDRVCIDSATGGYCTVQGCDYSTCPDEAVCVRFFTGGFANKPCDPATEDDGAADHDQCSLDELCSIAGTCVPRSSEIRFCMRKCGSDGDCRDNYECRDLERMMTDGGEPVLAPGLRVDSSSPKFCAAAPAT